MPKLDNYREFEGRHWETGTVRNFLAYRGVVAPHTGQPYSEAMLMGISGGAVMGYFSFAYQGYDPHVVILTRNTFDPLDTLLERLGVVQTLLQTNKPDKALRNLIETLDEGLPAIAWADAYSLPYNGLTPDVGMWGMLPVLVYGCDEAADTVWLADRARVPLTVTPAELAAARGRIKKDKHRLLLLDLPNPDKLTAAVQEGIWDCIKLYTEAPPKGSRENFGFASFRRWADLLTRPSMRMSWEREFPPGRKMLAGLTTTLTHVMLFGKDGGAERGLYADFLDEASTVLTRPGLSEAAGHFRRSAEAWDGLATALLPDHVSPFKETRELMLRSHRLFVDQGSAALDERRAITVRLDSIRDAVSADFPLDAPGVAALREDLAERVLAIHDIERDAVAAMQDAMG